MALETLISQVRWNCRVAGAAQAGGFSLCGLLLRLRQLYKWEHRLAPWQEPDPEPVLQWVQELEDAWDALEDRPWRNLPWNGTEFDPYAVESLNEGLLPQGLAYGAGFGRGLNPTFFLGELAETRRDGELTILILGPELARDLEAAPALRQGPLIYARRQALAYYLWDRLADPTQQHNAYLKTALEACQLSLAELLNAPETHQGQFAAFLEGEMEAIIHHELGEARERSLEGVFSTLLELFPQTRIELWLRTLKDALAEVNESGRLAYILQGRHLASLALMLAWRPGLYPVLLPELEPAFCRLNAHGDWEALELARRAALGRLRRVAADLTDLLASHPARSPDDTRREIEMRFLAPLGL